MGASRRAAEVRATKQEQEQEQEQEAHRGDESHLRVSEILSAGAAGPLGAEDEAHEVGDFMFEHCFLILLDFLEVVSRLADLERRFESLLRHLNGFFHEASQQP